MTLVEALSVDVAFVDIDLEQIDIRAREVDFKRSIMAEPMPRPRK